MPPVSLRESLVGKHIIIGTRHQLGELGVAGLEGLEQVGPVFFRVCQRILVEGRSGRRRDKGAILLANANQGIAYEVHATALDGLEQVGPVFFRVCQRILVEGRSGRRRDVLGAAVTMGRSFLPTQTKELRMKCTRQRWMVAPSTLAAATFRPLCSSAMISLTPRRPRSARERGNSPQNTSDSRRWIGRAQVGSYVMPRAIRAVRQASLS